MSATLNTPFRDVMPALPDEKYKELKFDIEQNGLSKSLLIDEANNIIDGHHRYKACQELGIEPKTELCAGIGDDQDKRLRIIALNLSGRELSAADRKRLAAEQKSAALKMLSDGRGVREVARLVGRAMSTVQWWRDADGDRSGHPAQPPTTTHDQSAKFVADGEKGKNVKQPTPAEQKEKALALAASGLRHSQIADAIGVHPQTVSNWINDPDGTPTGQGVGGGQSKKLKDADVRRLFESGLSAVEIATQLGAAANTVSAYLKRLGLGRAGKRLKNPLNEHIARAETETGTWSACADTVVATASISDPLYVERLVCALAALAEAARTLRNRLNKEVGKGER